MIARGFKPVAWVAAIGVAALSCYMLSLRVAAERADLASLDRRILETRQAIRSLQTELGTRGRLQQLEQWNADVLALSAPVASQFLESNVSLARFDTRPDDFANEQAEVRLAAANTAPAPAAPAAAPGTPRVTLAAAPATTAPKPLAQAPTVRRASLAAADPTTLVPRPAAATVRPAALRETPQRTATAPARTNSLLGADTLRDLRAEARAENSGGTRN